jgi:hypothetical protein
MTQRGPGQDPVAAPDTGPAAVRTDDELLGAVLALLGASQDRAVESRAGLSKTTVNDLRNGRRRLTLKTLTLLVEAYDPARRAAWVGAWHRLHPRPARRVGAGAVPSAGLTPGSRLSEAAATTTGGGGPDPRDPRDPRHPSGASRPRVPGDSRDAAVRGGIPAGRVPHPGEPGLAAVPPVPLSSPDHPDHPDHPDRPDHPAGVEDRDPGGDPSWSADGRVPASRLSPAGDPAEVPPGSRAAAVVTPAVPWRAVRALTGSAVVAAVAAVVAVVLVLTGGHFAVDPAAGGGPPPAGPAGDEGLPLPGPSSPGGAAPVGGPGPPPDLGGPPPAGVATAAPHGCYDLPLPTGADVVDGPGAETAGIRLTAASYHYFAAWNPSAAVGGRLSGRPAPGRRLIGAAWADPATRDSTAAHHHGNGRFYPGEPLELTDQNCFSVAPYNIGYAGYAGITTRVYVLSAATAGAPALPREAHSHDGLTAQDLTRLGADVLGYFAVPSAAWPGG